jgi:hypothetical protein
VILAILSPKSPEKNPFSPFPLGKGDGGMGLRNGNNSLVNYIGKKMQLTTNMKGDLF